MLFREATKDDFPQLMFVRASVKENALSNPALITLKDYEEYIVHRGRGWVCETEEGIVGFAIVDLINNNVWALFILPGYERRGIARKLHQIMLDWYFSKTKNSIWLGTAAHTRAERFYKKAGWIQNGFQANGEIRFEMSLLDWKKTKCTSE